MKKITRRRAYSKATRVTEKKPLKRGRIHHYSKIKTPESKKIGNCSNVNRKRRCRKCIKVNNSRVYHAGLRGKSIKTINRVRVVDKNNTKLRRIKRVNRRYIARRKVYIRNIEKVESLSKYELIKRILLVEGKKILKDLKNLLTSKEFKKAYKKIAIALIALLSVDMLDKSNREVFLKLDGQELTWNTSKNIDLSNYQYKLYRDRKLLTLTRGHKFIESISIDSESPEKISSVKIDKGSDIVEFSWKEPSDIGSKHKYKVVAIHNKTKKKYSSRTVKQDMVSGIDSYLLNINGKEYKTYTTSFKLNINALQTGVNTLKIVAIDKAGNQSEAKNISFKIDNTKFYLDGYKLATNNKEITNETYEIFLVKEKITYKDDKSIKSEERIPISIGDNMAQFFVKNTKPKVSNPRFHYINELIHIAWEENSFGISNTEFYIECKNKKTLKKYKSQKMNYDNGVFLPGYYYAVTNTPFYKVTPSDSYTMDGNVSLNYNHYKKDKIYYFHVAASDENGNMSKTKTLELDLEKFTSLGEMKDMVREFLYKNKGVDGNAYRRVTDDVYNTFTYKTIKQIKDRELKIALTPDDIGNYISQNHNVKPTNKNAQYIKEDSTIVYNTKAPLEYLIKEIVKAFDEYPKSPWSKNRDLLNLYKEENKLLKNGKCTPQEFLSEIVWLYVSRDEDFEYDMPKSYEFMKRYYKTIMLCK